MQVSRLSELGPRSIWDILDDTFDLYRERWVLLCGATALVFIPAYGVMYGLLARPFAGMMAASGRRGASGSASDWTGEIFLSIALSLPLLIVAQVLQSGATAVIVRDMLTERRITRLREAYSLTLKRFWSLFFGALAVGAAVLVGSCALYIGALYVIVVLAFVPQLILLEGDGIKGAFRRSQALVRSEWGRVFGLFLAVGTVTFFLQFGLSLLLQGGAALLFRSDEPGGNQATTQLLIGQALGALSQLVTAPITAIALTLLYYDLRVRREGFDLIAQAEAIDYPLAPDPFGSVSSEEARERQRRDQRRAERQARRGK